MPAYFESGVFGQNKPAWHKQGRVVAGTFNLDEAMTLGDLDWVTEKRPVYIIHPFTNNLLEVPEKFANVRTRDNKPLGIVGKEYQPIQNREAFSFLEQLMADRECRWETAISVRGGSTVAGIVSLPDSGIEIVKGDTHYQFLTVITTHDGSQSTKVFPTDVRVVCANTVQVALNGRDRGLTVNIRHSGDVQEKIRIGRDMLNHARADYQRFAQWQQELFETEARANQVDEFINALFPAADPTSKRSMTMRENKVMGLLNAVHEEQQILLPQWTQTAGQSAYVLFNGMTRFVDHSVADRKQEAAEYALVGGGNDFKIKATKLIADIFDVKLPEAVR